MGHLTKSFTCRISIYRKLGTRIPFLGLKNLLTALIGALVASSSRARAQLRKNKTKYIFIQIGPNSEQKYHAIYQTTGKLGHGIHFRCQI